MYDVKSSLDEVLEHHGVKGMKWGVRREGSSSSSGSSGSNAALSKLKSPHLSDTQKKVLVAGSVAVGLAAATILLNKYGGSLPSQLPSLSKAGEALRAASSNTTKAVARNTVNRAVTQRKAALNTSEALGQRRTELATNIDFSSRQGLLNLPSTQELIRQHGEVSLKYLNARPATRKQKKTLHNLGVK